MSKEKDLHPITRKEKILDGQDLAPVTRFEYFLKKAATKGEGGGSGLPAYSSSDIGKVLMVKQAHSDTPVEFFPRQSVTFTNNGVGILTDVTLLTPGSISLGTYMILRVWPEQSQDDFNEVELTYTYMPQLDANFFTNQDNTLQVGYQDATWFVYSANEITSVPEMQANIYDVTGVTVEWAEIPSSDDK